MGSKTTDEETADLRAATREAHEVLGDLRREAKGLRDLLAEVRKAAGEVFEERMAEQVNAGLAEYERSIRAAVVDATEGVDRRFDTISAILLGEGRKDGPSIHEIAESIAASRPPDTVPLPNGYDATTDAMGPHHAHEDGRLCAYHWRLGLWVGPDGKHECTRQHPAVPQ